MLALNVVAAKGALVDRDAFERLNGPRQRHALESAMAELARIAPSPRVHAPTVIPHGDSKATARRTDDPRVKRHGDADGRRVEGLLDHALLERREGVPAPQQHLAVGGECCAVVRASCHALDPLSLERGNGACTRLVVFRPVPKHTVRPATPREGGAVLAERHRVVVAACKLGEGVHVRAPPLIGWCPFLGLDGKQQQRLHVVRCLRLFHTLREWGAPAVVREHCT